jgi:hypothetical protein
MDRIRHIASIVGKRGRVSLAIEVEVAGLAVSVLADHVAVQIRLGRVLGDGGAGMVELADDVVVDRVPEVVDGHHG